MYKKFRTAETTLFRQFSLKNAKKLGFLKNVRKKIPNKSVSPPKYIPKKVSAPPFAVSKKVIAPPPNDRCKKTQCPPPGCPGGFAGKFWPLPKDKNIIVMIIHIYLKLFF